MCSWLRIGQTSNRCGRQKISPKAIGGPPKIKEFIACFDIATKRDRYAETVYRRKYGYIDGDPKAGSPNRLLSELQCVWAFHDEGLRYEEIERRYMNLIHRKELRGNCDELVDGTGVGDAVVERLRKLGGFPHSIVFTNGGRAHPVYAEIGQIFGDSRAGELSPMRTVKEWLVPRRDLVADGALLLEQGRLAFAKDLPFREAIEAQLTGFNFNQKKHKYEAETETLHDDFVITILMAAWWIHYNETEIVEGEVLLPEESAPWDPLEQFNLEDETDRDVPLQAGGGAWR